MANRVIPPHRRDPDDSHDSQYYRRGVDDIRNVITSTTEPLGAEPGTLWYNPEGVPDYGVDIGISKDDADGLYASKDEFAAVADVPGRVDAVEDTVVAVESTVQKVTSALAIDTAYPSLQAAMTAGAGGTVLVTTSQTVPPGLSIPAKTRVLVSPGVVLTRQQPTTGDWITVGEGATLDGGEYHGNKANATGFSRAYRAINVGANGTVQNAYVHDHNGHGVLLNANARAINVRSDNHGDDPGPNGTGDGLYVANVTGVLIDRCTADNNARMGVTVTSTSAPTSAVVRDTHAGTGNAYNAFDFERLSGGTTTTVHAQRITGGSVPCAGATVVLEDASVTRVWSSPSLIGTTDVTLRRVTLTPASGETATEIHAAKITLDDVQGTVNLTSGWGMAFYSGGPDCSAVNVRLFGAVNQGILFSCTGGAWRRMANCRLDSTATITQPLRRVGVRIINGGALRFLGTTTARFEVTEGRFRGHDTAATGAGWTGAFDAGDIIENTAPTAGGSMGWVYAGGAWKAYGTIDA